MSKKNKEKHRHPNTSIQAHAAETPHMPRESRMYLVYAALGGILLGLMCVAYSHGWFGGNPEKLGPVRVNQAEPPGPAPEGMVWIPGGVFWMGSTQFEDARPRHKVEIDGFWMDRTEVTNKQFAEFVRATGYITLVERWPDPEHLPGAKPSDLGFQHRHALLFAANPALGFPDGISWAGLFHGSKIFEPFSIVFSQPAKKADVKQDSPLHWWKMVPGACWAHPEGPGSNLVRLDDHPVVHICYEDAVAYCKWKKRRLPTEAEWEFAARGGLDRKPFAWGDEVEPGGKCQANTWQGEFPNNNTLADKFFATAPVASFPANGFGLHDMAGNVWEWCADWYRDDYYVTSPARNPQGPNSSHDPEELDVAKRVQRGGSFLCCDNYCKRYMPGARGKGDVNSTANHIGFRCAKSAQ